LRQVDLGLGAEGDQAGPGGGGQGDATDSVPGAVPVFQFARHEDPVRPRGGLGRSGCVDERFGAFGVRRRVVHRGDVDGEQQVPDSTRRIRLVRPGDLGTEGTAGSMDGPVRYGGNYTDYQAQKQAERERWRRR